jgi:hypothetical protein
MSWITVLASLEELMNQEEAGMSDASVSRENRLAIRRGLLLVIDAIERDLKIMPRTAALRSRLRSEESSIAETPEDNGSAFERKDSS